MFFSKLFANKEPQDIVKALVTQDFSAVKIKVNDLDIQLVAGEKFDVVFHGKENMLPAARVINHNLYIKQRGRLVRFSSWDNEQFLVITIPSEFGLDSVDIQTNEGNIELTAIRADRLWLKSSEGRVRIKQTTSPEANLESNDGHVTVRSSRIADGKLATFDGEIKVSGSQLLNMNLNISDGDIILTDNTIEGGSSTLKYGSFTLDHAVLKSDYQVKNIEGTNTAWSVNLKKAQVRTVNGQNNINIDPNPDGYILNLSTVDGDNVVQ